MLYCDHVSLPIIIHSSASLFTIVMDQFTDGPTEGKKGCFYTYLLPKAKLRKGLKSHETGVQCMDMVDNAYIGTCLMEDGRLQTYNYSDLKKAYRRYVQLQPTEHMTVPTM